MEVPQYRPNLNFLAKKVCEIEHFLLHSVQKRNLKSAFRVFKSYFLIWHAC